MGLILVLRKLIGSKYKLSIPSNFSFNFGKYLSFGQHIIIEQPDFKIELINSLLKDKIECESDEANNNLFGFVEYGILEPFCCDFKSRRYRMLWCIT